MKNLLTDDRYDDSTKLWTKHIPIWGSHSDGYENYLLGYNAE
jgi:hypothetical protein